MTPALLTGTSSEFLGKRALPRIVRSRSNVVVLGPAGSGKTSVAQRVAGPDHLYLDTRATQDALVQRIGACVWAAEVLQAPALVLDGPIWLHNRPTAVRAFAELMAERGAAGRRTVVCQCDEQGSVEALFTVMEPGALAIIGLRFPCGSRGRLRFARRMCDNLSLPRRAARGTDQLDPWDYRHVVQELAAWKE